MEIKIDKDIAVFWEKLADGITDPQERLVAIMGGEEDNDPMYSTDEFLIPKEYV